MKAASPYSTGVDHFPVVIIGFQWKIQLDESKCVSHKTQIKKDNLFIFHHKYASFQ